MNDMITALARLLMFVAQIIIWTGTLIIHAIGIAHTRTTHHRKTP